MRYGVVAAAAAVAVEGDRIVIELSVIHDKYEYVIICTIRHSYPTPISI